MYFGCLFRSLSYKHMIIYQLLELLFEFSIFHDFHTVVQTSSVLFSSGCEIFLKCDQTQTIVHIFKILSKNIIFNTCLNIETINNSQ